MCLSYHLKGDEIDLGGCQVRNRPACCRVMDTVPDQRAAMPVGISTDTYLAASPCAIATLTLLMMT